MKTITFTCLCIAAAFACFLAGFHYHKLRDMEMGYNQAIATQSALKDYQIDLQMDTVKIYDGQRLVGSYISTWTNQIDTILLKDNQ